MKKISNIAMCFFLIRVMHMLKRLVYLLPVIFCFLHTSCDQESKHRKVNVKIANHISASQKISKKPIIIDIVPFEDTPEEIISRLSESLKKIFPNLQVHNTISFPSNAFYQPRHRYKADSLINYLSAVTPAGHVSIGITIQDISTSKGDIEDWGVMGLSFMPGNSCIVSTFRLNKNNLLDQFFKVSIHELGHTQGLDHCDVKTCYMRDAEGKNTTDQEIAFCPRCKTYLIAKGWVVK